MTRVLHTRSKIFFTNPYVVRIEYDRDVPMTESEADYRKLMRRAYKLIQGTWGYCNLEYEELTLKAWTAQPVVIAQVIHGNANNLNAIFGAVFNPTWAHVARGYACFSDEEDALQFRLMSGAKAIRVYMWPDKKLFTIHELIEDEL